MDYSKGAEGSDIIIEFLDGSSRSFKPGKEAFKDADLRGAKLVSVDLARLDLRGADLSWADLRMSSLIGVRLEGATLREADLRFVDLRDADLEGAVLVRSELNGADLSGADLSGADLRGVDLSGATLVGANLSGANLSEADLEDADLRGADLSGVELNGAFIKGAKLKGACLSGADLDGANWGGDDFGAIIGKDETKDRRVNMSWIKVKFLHGETEVFATLVGADLRDADFIRAELSGADLEGADLSGADLEGVDLSGANLREATMIGVNLREADLSGADFSGVDLRDACLSGAFVKGANLRDACLRGATLIGADFRNSSLIGVELNGVDIRGVDFRGADVDTDGLSEAKLSGAKFGPLKDYKYKNNEVTKDRRVSMSLDGKGKNDEKSLSIEICLLDAAAVAPKYALAGDAGMDLTSVSFKSEYDFVEYDTGVAVKVPEGYVGLVFPRSSISKTGMRLKNGVGVIDSNYRGSIKLRFEYSGKGRMYNVGERIGQLVIMPAPQFKLNTVTFEEFTTEEGEASARGEGAFGSTGHSSFYHVFIMMLVAYAIIAFLGTLTGLGALNGSDVELFSNVPTNWI